MLENLDKIMHLRFNFDACPMHSPSGFVHLTHQNLSARALFCLNSLAKVNTQLLIYNYPVKCYNVSLYWHSMIWKLQVSFYCFVFIKNRCLIYIFRKKNGCTCGDCHQWKNKFWWQLMWYHLLWPRGVLKFEFGTDVRPEVSTTIL